MSEAFPSTAELWRRITGLEQRNAVSVSRGAHDAQIFTNDREKLPIALGHDVSQQSAHAPQIAIEKGVSPQQDLGEKIKPQSVQEQDISYGFSIG